MNRDEKAAAIAEIAHDIEESSAIFAVDYRGISVTQAADLRSKLRESDTRFRVVKNTLTERAADQAGAEALKELLSGPTALAFVRGDAAAAAKAIADEGRATELLPFKGGLMDGATLDAGQIVQISKLPSRQVLVGQLVNIVAAPINGLARTLNALVGGLAQQLGQIAEQGLVGGDAQAPAADAPAPDAPAEPAADAEPAPEPEPEPEPPAEPAADVPTEAGVEPTDADQDAEAPTQPETTDAPAEGADDTPSTSNDEE